jgi:hypothetical protein
MADIKMTQRYALRQARVRALRIVAAYASIRELSESEFCKLVDDLTIASLSPSADEHADTIEPVNRRPNLTPDGVQF